MKICPSCGRENANDRDFCDCGEYLRWEKTQFVESVKPVAASATPPPAAQTPARVIGANPAQGSEAPTASNGGTDANVTLAPGRVPGAAPSVPPVQRQSSSGDEPPPGAATLLLRMPDEDGAEGKPVVAKVTPGQRTTMLGLIRNESGVVDNYELKVSGLPDGWWTVTPAIAYLVPYGTGGNSEQEFQVALHPPRTPDAQARPWSLGVAAFSRAYAAQVASSPATVEIAPYQDLAAKLAPDRAAGRLKAHFKLTVSNRANAPTDAALTAEDADGECQFRFAEPAISLNPGGVVEAPFTVFPPKQLWIGRPQDRQIRVAATPAGSDAPQTPLPAVYRQKPWLPWWMAIVLPLAAVLIALYIALSPKQTTVPKVVGTKSVFDAQKLLVGAGMKLSPQVNQAPDPKAPPGSVIDQTPKAGAKAKRGTLVSVKVAIGSTTSTVPSVVGLTPVAADAALRASTLALGAVSPKLDPKANIASQIPGAGEKVAAGTPIAVFLKPSAALLAAKAGAAGAAGAAGGAAAGHSGAGSGGSGGGGSGGGAGGSGAGGAGAGGAGGAGGQILIPAASGTLIGVAQQLSQLGLVPSSKRELNPAPAGTVFGTAPATGSKVAAGSAVTVLVSAGYPQLSYDDGNAVHVVNGATGKTTIKIPAGGGAQSQAAWSKDGTHLIYSQGGQLWLLDATRPKAPPLDLTAPNSADFDPSLAPTTSANIVSFIKAHNGTQLCFATIGPNTLNPDCTSHPGFTLGHPVAWSPDGTAILVFAQKTGNRGQFGLIEFNSNVPFSTHAADWGQGQVVTPIIPGEGVISGQFSPDGKQVALVSDIGTRHFSVYLVKPNDLGLSHASTTTISACQVAWRPDGKVLAVMQADSVCAQNLGNIATVALSNTNTVTTVATQAENPAWQPVSTGG